HYVADEEIVDGQDGSPDGSQDAIHCCTPFSGTSVVAGEVALAFTRRGRRNRMPVISRPETTRERAARMSRNRSAKGQVMPKPSPPRTVATGGSMMPTTNLTL